EKGVVIFSKTYLFAIHLGYSYMIGTKINFGEMLGDFMPLIFFIRHMNNVQIRKCEDVQMHLWVLSLEKGIYFYSS
ncbi:hypothetical protein, partial [Rhizobium leguminosarum]|uniref:hypothetical protein n=1 Tax=Rhizobium leguminosarum TaxID=384 RepID=UPI003F9AB865